MRGTVPANRNYSHYQILGCMLQEEGPYRQVSAILKNEEP